MPALAALSFAEASFFPLIPEVLLGPMVLARREKWWLYAGVCSLASVLGGLFGYAIGVFLRRLLATTIRQAFFSHSAKAWTVYQILVWRSMDSWIIIGQGIHARSPSSSSLSQAGYFAV